MGTRACPLDTTDLKVWGQSSFGESPSACPGVPWLWGGSRAAWLQWALAGAQRQQTSEPRWVRVRAGRSPPSPPVPRAPPSAAPSSRGPRGGSAESEERRLLADGRGMSSGGSRHVTRRRSSSSPSRGSNFQPLPPWEQRRAALAPPGGAGGCAEGLGEEAGGAVT